MKYPPLDPATIKNFDFPEDQYVKTVHTKKQIVLHHTASGPGAQGDIKWWLTDPRRVGTTVIIGRDGEIDQCFESKYWAGHLGTGRPNNTELDQHSIGIEIDAWGPLWYHEGAYRSYLGVDVPVEDVVAYPMGFKTLPGDSKNVTYFSRNGAGGGKACFYHKYTDKQILAVAQLLEKWGAEYNIPLTYNPEMWDLSRRALAGEPGIWTHVSYRKDKMDCHPQPELIAMLKSLTPSEHEHTH